MIFVAFFYVFMTHKSVLFRADLLLDKNIDHTEKKAQNSNIERGRLHDEIEV